MRTQSFTIELIDNWSAEARGAPELARTSGMIRIAIGDQVVTRAEDDRSRSVHDAVGLSAYPLALWLASSWWRLRWEPAPKGTVGTSWKMAHQMPAADYGYIWPPLEFQSDGDRIEASAWPSTPAKAEPIRYLSTIRAVLEPATFERTVDDFLALVLNRLDAVGLSDTELHRLWREVLEERADTEASLWRQLEALLGFEPDDAPENIVQTLVGLAPETGRGAIAEIASACAGPALNASIEQALGLRRSGGLQGEITPGGKIGRAFLLSDIAHQTAAPYERGRLLARDLRQTLGYASGSVSDAELSGLLGLTEQRFKYAPATGAPFGVAIREDAADRARLFFRRRNRPGKRFEAARFIADHLVTPPEEHWLPSTDAKTARQKLQRAFAAEFLCPIDAVLGFLDDDFSNEAIEDAGREFGISPLAVRSHLVNNDILPHEALVA